ncbi:MAG: hypothetical protein ACI970_001616 [Myxococcota bacterium]
MWAVVPEFTGRSVWSMGSSVIGGLGYSPGQHNTGVKVGSGVEFKRPA